MPNDEIEITPTPTDPTFPSDLGEPTLAADDEEIEGDYLDSTAVRLYPTAYRGHKTSGSNEVYYNPESRLNTEYNITKMTERLVDSYIIGVDTISVSGTVITADIS